MTEGIDFIQRARDLAPMLEEAGDEIERRRELPEHVVATLIDGGFFRILQPRFLGGAELRPVLFTQVTEALATTNASVGWCVGQSNGCSMTSVGVRSRAAVITVFINCGAAFRQKYTSPALDEPSCSASCGIAVFELLSYMQVQNGNHKTFG
jgi:hypothetical protein